MSLPFPIPQDNKWVLDEVENELAEKIKKKHCGNVVFKVNMFMGGISNINVGGERSIKNPQPKGGRENE